MYMYILFKGGDIKKFNSNKTMNNLSIISNLLIIINSSVNFFVYLNKDPKFLLAFYHCISSSVESSCAEICHVAPDTESCLLRWVHQITFHHQQPFLIMYKCPSSYHPSTFGQYPLRGVDRPDLCFFSRLSLKALKQ